MWKNYSPKSGWDTGVFVLRAFKLDHLQTIMQILFLNSSFMECTHSMKFYPSTYDTERDRCKNTTFRARLGGSAIPYKIFRRRLKLSVVCRFSQIYQCRVSFFRKTTQEEYYSHRTRSTIKHAIFHTIWIINKLYQIFLRLWVRNLPVTQFVKPLPKWHRSPNKKYFLLSHPEITATGFLNVHFEHLVMLSRFLCDILCNLECKISSMQISCILPRSAGAPIIIIAGTAQQSDIFFPKEE